MAALAAALILVAGVADARPGRGIGGLGSRGARTFQAPPATNTAPRTAAPIERSATQPGQPGQPGFNQAAPRGATAAAGGFFSRRGGLMGGLVGAGLIGALLGYGLFGGLGGIGSILGILLQLALIVVLVRWAVRAYQRRSQPAYAGGSMARTASPPLQSKPIPGFGGGSAAQTPLAVRPSDYDAFEKLLETVQTAYGAGDRETLRRHVTPEMAGYFEGELDADAARGVVNRIDGVRLVQGDLAEAWREGRTDYASVAMRYALVDRTVELSSGRVVEGDEKPTEVTELWTFRRDGGDWALSAIQQG